MDILKGDDFMKEKFIFSEKTDNILDIEKRWIKCKEHILKRFLERIIEENKILGIHVNIESDFIIKDYWVYRLQGYFMNFNINNLNIKNNIVEITIPDNLDIDYITSKISELESLLNKISDDRVDKNHIFNEDKSVKWNREQVTKHNEEISKKYNFCNKIYFLLKREKMNILAKIVKDMYKLSASIDDINIMLNRCVPCYNEKDIKYIRLEDIEYILNPILSVFKERKTD